MFRIAFEDTWEASSERWFRMAAPGGGVLVAAMAAVVAQEMTGWQIFAVTLGAGVLGMSLAPLGVFVYRLVSPAQRWALDCLTKPKESVIYFVLRPTRGGEHLIEDAIVTVETGFGKFVSHRFDDTRTSMHGPRRTGSKRNPQTHEANKLSWAFPGSFDTDELARDGQYRVECDAVTELTPGRRVQIATNEFEVANGQVVLK